MADGTPRNPAPVSGPGALSQRTDGGPGNAKQPIRVPTGGAFGEAKAAEAQQSAAPMAAGGPAVGGAPPAQGAPPAAQSAGAFGPTQRPGESNAAQLSAANNPVAANPQAALRAMYARFPHPSIARLIDWSATGGNELA